MNNVPIKFFKDLYNDDIIYHYTKAPTAIDFILNNNQLRFKSARLSNDPIESKKAKRNLGFYDEQVHTQINRVNNDELNQLDAFICDLEDRFNQICFCQNTKGEDFANENYISNFEGNEEIFGFTKLRMWDQYADKFTGVCIAFSKQKILSLNKSNLELVEANIKYLSFQQLFIEKLGNIQWRHYKNVGLEQYKELAEQLIKAAFFYKHIDYSGENEYRIGTLFDKAKCGVEIFQDEIVSNSMMLDISGCIEAIFVSCYANDKQKKALLEYANKLNVKIIEMKWQYNSFEVNDYKESVDFLNSIVSHNTSKN